MPLRLIFLASNLLLFAPLSFAMVSSRALGQFINWEALMTLRRVAVQPSLAVPHIRVPHVGCVDWTELKAAGIRGVAFDKDNTLTAPYSDELDPVAQVSVEHCQKAFGTDRIVIVSNSAGGRDDTGWENAEAVENSLGITVLRHGKKKPAGGRELMEWFEARDSESKGAVAAHEIAFVGDRLLTDVVFGNLLGMLTIHVKPLTLTGDNVAARFVRSGENRILLPFLGRIRKEAPVHPLESAMQTSFSRHHRT